MNVVCGQLNTIWEDKPANHNKVLALLDAAAPQVGSLVVLPEMFATGFSMNVAGISDSQSRETQDFMAKTAAGYRVWLLGGVVTTAPDGRGRNECILFSPEGNEVCRRSKMHLFPLSGEPQYYVRGEAVRTFACEGAIVAPFICYELRFPEVFRVGVQLGATVLIVIANWPDARHHHWEMLLMARAVENQAYVVGVNRRGSDPQFTYLGQSMIIDPHGAVLAEAGNRECTINAELEMQLLLEYRRTFPVLEHMKVNCLWPHR